MSFIQANRRQSASKTLASRRKSRADTVHRAAVETLESRRLLAAEFQPTVDIDAQPFSASQGGFRSVEIADFNSDGRNDVVALLSPRPGSSTAGMIVYVGRNVSDGNFAWTTYSLGNVPAAGTDIGGLAVADLTGDGVLDLAVGRFTNTNVYILPGAGNGTFNAPITIGLNAGEGPRNIVTGDFNADGRQDMAVSFLGSPRVALFSGTGGGAFTRQDTVMSANVNSLAAGDLDADGATDLGIGKANGYISLRNLDGTPQAFDVATTNASLVRIGKLQPTDPSPRLVAQIVTPSNPGQRTLIAQSVNGLDNQSIISLFVPIDDFKIADLDQDGFGDIAIAANSQGYLLDGSQIGNNPGLPIVLAVGSSTSVAIGDLNADTLPDYLIGTAITSIAYRLQQSAESLVVTTAVDENNGNARPSAGTGTSLREAFEYAKRLGGNQTITFASSLGNANAVLDITGDTMTLSGLPNSTNITVRNDSGRITLRGNGTRSLFNVQFLGVLNLENLNITNFRASDPSTNGGAVYVASLGTLNVVGSSFYNNTSPGAGGAVFAASGAVTLFSNSTFNGNGGLGAIALDTTSSGSTLLQNNTIVGNAGGGVRAVAGTVRLFNNIVSGNGTADLVGTGSFIGDRNIVQTGSSGGLTNTINADPMLSALASNGGRTLTMLPTPLSPAVNAGATLAGVSVDQRGITRPQIGTPDLGSVELSPGDLPGVTTPDGARWFLFGSLNGNQRIFRAAPGQSAVEVGGLGVSLGLQADGNVVVRDAGGFVYTRVGSANGVGSDWLFRTTVVAGDGATWFLGSAGSGGNFDIYRWSSTGAPQFAGGNGVRLVAVNGYAITQNAAGAVFLRTGSNVGFGSEWIVQSSAIAGDSATWFVGVTTVGVNGPIYRWATDGGFLNSGGVAATLSRESGGTVLARQTGGSIFSRLGSANGLGTLWTERARTTTADGAAWFLGTESATADQRIYRWASNSPNANDVGGLGVTITLINDGSVITRDGNGSVFIRPGSASGVGGDWVVRPSVITVDGATWFLSTEAVGADRAIYRWLASSLPTNTTGAGQSLVISPTGDVRATNGMGQVFQAIGSSSGFSSEWRLLTESLVVTTTADENDFTSSSNLGAGTSLREAIAYAEANPGPDTITFAAGLNGQTLASAFGWNGTADDSTFRVSGALTLDGGNQITLTTAAGNARRLFASTGGTFTLRNLTISDVDSRGVADGAALWTSATVFIDNVRFQNNKATNGGAIANFGNVTVSGATFQNNLATDTGGAIESWGALSISDSLLFLNSASNGGAINSAGVLTINRTTFSTNNAGFNGGALRLFGTADISSSTLSNNTAINGGGGLISHGNTTITNATIAYNTSLDGGGAQFFEGTAAIRHATIAYNFVTRAGGGLAVNFADVTLSNTLVAGNAAVDQNDYWGAAPNAASAGNLINASAAAARLGASADNGGATTTIELLPGSPAINAGIAIAGITTDQRGTSRTQGSAPDIGAYERVATSASLTSSTFEFDTRQALVFNFSNDASVVFDRSSYILTNLTTGQPVPSSAGTLSWNSTGTQAVLELTGLADAVYQLQAGSTTLNFHILAGDADRDRDVDFDDLITLARNYNQTGRTYAQGNFDYSADGLVGFSDLSILARNYRGNLPADFARANGINSAGPNRTPNRTPSLNPSPTSSPTGAIASRSTITTTRSSIGAARASIGAAQASIGAARSSAGITSVRSATSLLPSNRNINGDIFSQSAIPMTARSSAAMSPRSGALLLGEVDEQR